MFLDLPESIEKGYFRNVYDVKICDDGSAWPVRFSDKLFSVYSEVEGRKIRSYCASGVCIDLITSSDFIYLYVDTLSFARDFAYFDLYIDDIFVETIGTEPVEKLDERVSFQLIYEHINGKTVRDSKEQRVTIYLPHLVDIHIKAIEVEDKSIVRSSSKLTEKQKNLLCLGDSITQGMTAKRPSSMFSVQLARKLGMNLLNHGVGGHVFDEDVIDGDMGINPDIITVAYGVNDWSRYESMDIFSEKCRRFFDKLINVYHNAKIFVITPIWTDRENESRAIGSLSDIRREIECIAGEYEGISIINGLEMLPNMSEFLQDGVHPNDDGFAHYSVNLLAELCASRNQ
ncbi:MAG: SGNH/GDSL hydrolase family protein [Clostridiales bacterium]|nr:SGNH/GDSL hydrolase family protein [Clostridiales bacterium]